MRKLAFLVAGVFAGVAVAGVTFDTEPNNTPGTANPTAFSLPFGDAHLVDGVITPGDVDWYAFAVPGAGAFKAAVYGLPFSTVGDSTLQLLAPDGTTILEFDDDDNISFFSSLEETLPAAGIYYIGVSGYADGVLGGGPMDGIDDFTGGPHGERFEYKLLIGGNFVPEPASLALLGLGALVLRRRR